MKNGISGTDVYVKPLFTDKPAKCGRTKEDLNLAASHHPKGDDFAAINHCPGAHHHRSFTDIKAIVNSSALSERVKGMSIRMFAAVAKAEGKVHGRPAEHVHCHEVGGMDSIVQLGGGFVRCAHGLLPIPTPATSENLQDVPVKAGVVQ